jgi:acetylornithine deacetylase/succinyl-diaminopimelate desuccinylase-like protein
MSTAGALAYARSHQPQFVAELKQFARFPSVSAQPRFAAQMSKCASWLAAHLRRIGLERVRTVPTSGPPIVYAEWRHAPRRPTLLVYGHYDVQPADPVGEWRSPPFEPTLRGENVYGRGVCDNKGQMLTHVKAIESFLATARALPVNVKCVFEGEEEVGSANLMPFVAGNRRALAADAFVLSDTVMLGPEQPALTHATRGDLYLELEVRGPKHDLHSGNFGGAIHNPLQALCEIVGKLHDANGHIAIPGIYDRVRQWRRTDKARLAEFGAPDALILEDAAAERGWGEPGYSLYERVTIRPALTFNGIVGGYRGPGRKGVIPARAAAKLSFRLVPDQDPRDIERLIRGHIARLTPPTVTTQVRTVSGSKPSVVESGHPVLKAAARAYTKGFGTPPVLLRSGGTIPAVTILQEMLKATPVLMGFALPDDAMHAPNEKFHLPTFFNGIATSIWFLAEMGALEKAWPNVETRTGIRFSDAVKASDEPR